MYGAVVDVAFGSPTARKGRGRRNVAILPIRSGDLRFLTARHRCEDEPFVSTLRSCRDARRSVVETQRGRRSGPGRVGAASHADRPQARLAVCGLRNSSTAETRFLVYLLLGATSACGGDSGLVSGAWCNEPGREWDLLISTIVIGALAAFVVWLVRGRQLQRWNLRKSPVAPSTTVTLWTIAVCAVVPTVLLSLSVYGAEACAPDQRTANILYLWMGVLLATTACLAGLLVAKTTYVKGSSR